MAKGQLWEYAVLYHPRSRKDAEEKGVEQRSVLLVGVTHVVASGEQEVRVLAARALPEEYLDRLDDVEIVVRPFGRA